jgi:hypothetical protein
MTTEQEPLTHARTGVFLYIRKEKTASALFVQNRHILCTLFAMFLLPEGW